MQFSEHWLRQYVNPALDSQGLSHALTMAGLEVEELEPVAAAFTKVVVAEIISAEKHPDADRLQVCKVDVGNGEPLQIVCGAPNARAGLKAPCALVGAELPGFKIKQAKVRGVESFGMMCSAKELGLAEESDGILELSADAQVGQDIRALFDLDDKLFTLKLTPNRTDCLSIAGIARDVTALTGASLTLPEINPVAAVHTQQQGVKVSEPDACPRYAGRLIQGVNATAPTPDWMVRRLERSGIRSISAIVDITNYVLLEQGQPLHAFDADKLKGDIEVRYARSGEALLLLNDENVTLSNDMLVIADDSSPLALAGIMGGDGSAVGDATRNIFLESAFFAPAVIVGKARRLNFSTDSSYRFERGVDFGNTVQALERASQLILEICGGQAGPVTEVLHDLPERKPVRLRLDRLNSVLGIVLDAAIVGTLLERLNFSFTLVDGGFEVVPPSYRFDIEIEEDLIEEVARLHGYDNIPALAPHDDLQMLPAAEARLSRNWLRDTLAASGYQEIVSYSFVDEAWERDFLGNANPIALKNPIASNLSVMRSGLWAGLIETLTYNLNRRQERVRLFEIGSAYFAEDAAYREVGRISGLAYGDAEPEQWALAAREVDFFDVKAAVDRLTNGRAQYVAAQHAALHPGQTAQIVLDGQPVGWIGKLHPKWQQHYQLPRSAVLFELDVEPLLQREVASYAQVAKFPPVRRDIAVVVDEITPIQSLLDTMRSSKNTLISEISLFDVYRGKGIAEGKKSLAFLVLMQDTQKTLTDAEADAVMAELLDLLVRHHGAALRN
ncbi:phenylalanine--tRNA ligase subunit beta [Methylobacillus arboreus]|uniref:phenylalanine--tRNA ligase subunit beta n=1 Tax=Methylobacillus arboreus TaxID=755170 RepID=UPI001E3058DD|nr:phenylalanine--tRNA ligase subunit beta [Methylobacillus arboreus]MCB5189241.1 phenylalanine--tRNA ligase subunit beta [Methylobacillus arboreus]